MRSPECIAVLGSRGYLGQIVTRRLARMPGVRKILSIDVKPPQEPSVALVQDEVLDVRSAELRALLDAHDVDTVVHLASVVHPPRGMSRNEQYSIDVDGTHNVLEACLEHRVGQLVVISSGAAYGYHVDNPPWLDEDAPLRGNEAFPYARHKRLVEEMLARYRHQHPGLRQLVFRPGTILGTTTRNQITALLERRVMLSVTGGDSRFVFVWDEDVAECVALGVSARREGIFNLAGDGAVSTEELAGVTGARVLDVSPALLGSVLRLLRAFEFTDYGPEHVPFLRHRPVLSNRRLKEEFGFAPTRTSVQAFAEWWEARSRQGGKLGRTV